VLSLAGGLPESTVAKLRPLVARIVEELTRQLASRLRPALAGITTPEPRMLMIQPWDATTLHPIEKAIQKSNLGLTPSVQGRAIRIFFPELSQERRQEFVKIVRKMAEDGRVAIRHVCHGVERAKDVRLRGSGSPSCPRTS
jgi:ribosome recycling factor